MMTLQYFKIIEKVRILKRNFRKAMTSVQISKWRETPSFPDPLVARKRLQPPLFP